VTNTECRNPCSARLAFVILLVGQGGEDEFAANAGRASSTGSLVTVACARTRESPVILPHTLFSARLAWWRAFSISARARDDIRAGHHLGGNIRTILIPPGKRISAGSARRAGELRVPA